MLKMHGGERGCYKNRSHCGKQSDTLALIARHLPKGEAKSGCDQQDCQHLCEVRERSWVLVGMRRVDTKEAATVRSELLYCDL